MIAKLWGWGWKAESNKVQECRGSKSQWPSVYKAYIFEGVNSVEKRKGFKKASGYMQHVVLAELLSAEPAYIS